MKAPPRPGFLLVAAREWRWMRRDRLALFLAIGVPVFAFAVLALIFSNAVIRNLKVTVVDADRSPTSLTYVQATASAPGISVAERSGDMTSAMHAIRSGDAIAAIYIPENFERDLVAAAAPEDRCALQPTVFHSRQQRFIRDLQRRSPRRPRRCRAHRRPAGRSRRGRWLSSNMCSPTRRRTTPSSCSAPSCRPFFTSSSRSPPAMRSGPNFRAAACVHGSRPPAAVRLPRFSASSRRCLRFLF